MSNSVTDTFCTPSVRNSPTNQIIQQHPITQTCLDCALHSASYRVTQNTARARARTRAHTHTHTHDPVTGSLFPTLCRKCSCEDNMVYGVGGLISGRDRAQPGGNLGCRKTMTNVYAWRWSDKASCLLGGRAPQWQAVHQMEGCLGVTSATGKLRTEFHIVLIL